jgi:hypothetical protein
MLRRGPNEHVKTGLQFAQDRILRESGVLLLCSPTPWREKGMTSLRLPLRSKLAGYRAMPTLGAALHARDTQLDRKEVGATEKACLC